MADVYTVDIIGRRNADLWAPFTLTDSDGVAIDITGSTFALKFVQVVPPGETAFTHTISTGSGEIIITNAAAGQFALTMDHTVWVTWPLGKYKHDLVRDQGLTREVVWIGSLLLKDGITP